MSQSLSAARLTHLAAESRTDAECARIVRTDGTTIGVTNHVTDLTIGAVTYLTAAGYTPTAVSSSADYQAQTVDVEAIMAVAGIARADVEAGLYDYARVYIFLTDYTAPVVDEHPLYSGTWGKVELRAGRFVTQFYGLKDQLHQNIGDTYNAACNAVLGDSKCKVNLSPATWAASTAYTATSSGDADVGDLVKPTTENGYWFKCTTAGTSDSSEPSWNTTVGGETTDGTVTWTTITALQLTGTVTGVTDNRQFQDSNRADPDEWWDYGYITWTGGNNNGRSAEVKSFTYVSGSPGTPEFQLFLPMPNTVQAGDTYTVTVGCRKRFTEDCIGKFDNSENFRGHPHIPTNDQARKFGGQ